MNEGVLGFRPMEEFVVRGKRVLLRVDINSPIDPKSKKIVNDNRLQKSIPTIKWLLDHNAKVALIAHQGDTLDYQNLIPLTEHAERLSALLGKKVRYIDDVCGPMAQAAVEVLDEGEAILLGNLRYLCEEVSTFEDAVQLTPKEMLNTWLVRTLAPMFELYVNDAFAAAHRNSPSMVAFQEVLPSAAGPLFCKELTALNKVMKEPVHPSLFVLGGAKISDAFGMMEQVLVNGTADEILTCGVTGEVFLLASGKDLGMKVSRFLDQKGLTGYIKQAAEYLRRFGEKIRMPEDLAYEEHGERKEIPVSQMPEELMYLDVGEKTIKTYSERIGKAGTIFVNGPAGVFEDPKFEAGTRDIWRAIADAPGFTVIGGGDSVSAAARFTELEKMSYVCTAGGAMVRYISGRKLPLIEAMEKAARST